MAKQKKIHWFESFVFPKIYAKRGLVWQIACRRRIPTERDDIEGSTNPDDVTCEHCRRYFK